MKNLILQPAIRQKIDIRVEKILRDLGNPEPPLKLEEVRELLRLHVGFYQTDNDGFMERAIHNLVMAGKQILARPSILLDVVRKRGIKALVIPDQRRILIDQELHVKKHRWAEGHETIHTILEWHEPILHGDNEVTMRQSCLDKVEAEANYGAGQLLFLRQRFASEALDSPPSVELVKRLAKSFNNTHASTLWRLVETAGRECPMLGVMHYHPAARFASNKNDPANPCRHYIRSDAFAAQFSAVGELAVFEKISSYIQPKRGGPVGTETVVLTDDNGDHHEFIFETFNFGRECLTLAVHARKCGLIVKFVPS
jgi:hypothetical protein